MYKQVPFESGFWGSVPNRGGFVPPEDKIAHLAADRQDAVRQIYRCGIEPDIASLAPSKLRPGQYHPRIWRGYFDPLMPLLNVTIDPVERYGSTFIQSLTSATSLFDGLLQVFKVLEPDGRNWFAFGHRLRELLILACTEVETNLRGVFLANFPQNDSGARTSTREYVALQQPLGLRQWTLKLGDYPNVEPLAPFHEWDRDRPTQSLPWYDAYNLVKHDRQSHFSRANLGQLLAAMAALHAVLAAQWGPAVFSLHRQNYSSPFIATGVPVWPTGEFYLGPLEVAGPDSAWRPVPLAELTPPE